MKLLVLTAAPPTGNLRVFLEDGTELKSVSGLSTRSYGAGMPQTVTVEFRGVEVVKIDRAPLFLESTLK